MVLTCLVTSKCNENGHTCRVLWYKDHEDPGGWGVPEEGSVQVLIVTRTDVINTHTKTQRHIEDCLRVPKSRFTGPIYP